MRITTITERAVPVASPMRNAAFDFSEMTTSIVAVTTDVMRGGKPVVGYAFNSTGRYACGAAMRARFIPRILSARPDDLMDAAGLVDPNKVLARMMLREKPGGDAERSVPIGTIETAVWDALAKALDRPLWHVLAERFNQGQAHASVPCYVGGGWYQPENDLASLADEVKRHLDAGYTHLKIKVGGVSIADDVKRIEQTLKLLPDASHLAVDANAALGVRTTAYAHALAPFALRWFEEPCAPLDYAGFAALAQIYDAPLATGENLFCLDDVDNLMRFGGFRRDRDIVQVDPPQAYGIGTYVRMIERVEAAGGARLRIFPHGGNMMSFALVAGLGLGGCESYPGVFAAFGGFGEGMQVRDGQIALPSYAGIGFEAQPELYKLMREMADT